ncbi:uncharacterized protein LOC116619237 isoform X2 [Nematostella vectensis]|uniref:uncharacterized protein LOC116619237 isoform X2 n=1 Tax=Nematostella vectensis TaxID=45351 RepID=UPI0020771C0B|nr:uncharacterized protein LOC116619237 isoform X2 [Nematostella vectensis]
MEKLTKELEAKLKTLRFRVLKTNDVLTKDKQALERHYNSITNGINAVSDIKEQLEEKKFAKGESEEEIGQWGESVEKELEDADSANAKLQAAIQYAQKEEEDKRCHESHLKQLKYQQELLQQKATFEKDQNTTSSMDRSASNNSATNTKLPKLTITKFNGKSENWLSFWGKFSCEVDATNASPVTKFAYLKEYLIHEIRQDIDGLPFTAEGYEKAKTILKEEYGNSSDIINIYIKNIMDLPVITGTSPRKVKDFYKTLRFNVQSLETLGRLRDVRGNVRGTLDKLKGIKSDLVRGCDGWRDWGFNDLLQQLKRWTEINPVESNFEDKTKSNNSQQARSSRLYQTSTVNCSEDQRAVNNLTCVYCGGAHKGVDCAKVTDIKERKRILVKEKLCFNCTKGKHRAEECKSKSNCFKCKQRHHTSICDSDVKSNSNPLLVTAGVPVGQVVYPVVIVDVEGIKCRALLDTGAGSSYASAALLDRLKKRQDLTAKYAEIIEEQITEGIVEAAEGPSIGREFYIPHKPVLRTQAESSKLRIVYDASAKEHREAPSLNDCLHKGPPLQNKIWDVLVRGRFNTVAITGDLQKAFLQVRVRECDRDAMIRKELYVDDLISGASTVKEARELKEKATQIFQDAGFKLHKWHSNAKELESEGPASEDSTYAKQELGVPVNEECSLLGLGWQTGEDKLSVTIPQGNFAPTKRGILAKLARVYDPLGLLSPTTLSGKLVYRSVCDAKMAWDAPISDELKKVWSKWENSFPQRVEVPRSLVTHREVIKSIELHSFGDASAQGVSACVYAVVTQESGVNQGLVAAKARLAKQGLTIPRLELVAGHMAVNLINNVKGTLDGLPVSGLHCWLDSTVALYWINNQGDYKQFVSNRVHKINSHQDVSWHHVPTKDNPADLGSRGGSVVNADMWWKGPEWLSEPGCWPEGIVLEQSVESKAEAKLVRQVLSLAVAERNEIDELLEKYPLHKAVRICCWMRRFAYNCQSRKKGVKKRTGPLLTEETEIQRCFWIKQAQNSCDLSDDRIALNLQLNGDGLLECRGRVQGQYPVYLPHVHIYTQRIVEEAHLRTIHGGVGLTMAKVREDFWVPRLRQLVRKVRKKCHGCKRFQAVAYSTPPPADLPVTRTQGTSAYQVIGVDFAGPIKYRVARQKEEKAYVLLYTCSLTRGIYLDLLPSLETPDCLHSLKQFIARRGRPDRIYSDNGRTFVGAEKWIKQVMQDERLQDYLSVNQIRWQFNLSRAPWWGGQFERMIGLVKASLHKSIGHGMLYWKELQEILLDMEITLNNRPLSYIEDDVQLPLLTPHSLLFIKSNTLPEIQAHHIQDTDLRKRAKHLIKCKDAVWKRWTDEYLRGLRERHRAKAGAPDTKPTIGEVVIVKSEEKNRGKWQLGIVSSLITSKDGEVRGAKLRAGKSYIERPVQLLYPLELKVDDVVRTQPDERLRPNAAEFRPRRDAAAAARLRMQGIADDAENL